MRWWSPELGARGWIGLFALTGLVALARDLPEPAVWWHTMLIWLAVILGPVQMLRVDAIDRERLEKAQEEVSP